MMSKKDLLKSIVYFGAIWGIIEATLGYVLQFLPPLVSGSVMFPIAATIMVSAYFATKNKKAIFYVALVAASIKAVNFLLPGLMPIKTYNPMIAILLQSIIVFVAIAIYEKRGLPHVITSFVVASIGWRILFLANITINNALTGFNFPQLRSLETMVSFTLYQGLIGALFLSIIYTIYYFLRHRINLYFKPTWVVSLPLVVLAVILTFLL
jgi:hypothetical protein